MQADADDLLQETILTMCDAAEGMPWDPDRSSVTTHARFVMKQLAKKRWRTKRRKRDILTDRDEIEQSHASSSAPADGAIERGERLAEDRRLGELLRRRLNPFVLTVFEHRCRGVDHRVAAVEA